jgi:hypothetical protein
MSVNRLKSHEARNKDWLHMLPRRKYSQHLAKEHGQGQKHVTSEFGVSNPESNSFTDYRRQLLSPVAPQAQRCIRTAIRSQLRYGTFPIQFVTSCCSSNARVIGRVSGCASQQEQPNDIDCIQ